MNALLDFIEALPVDDPAQLHAREWAQRVHELQKRQVELGDKIVALVAADDPSQLDSFVSAVAEHSKVSAELANECLRQMEFVSRLHQPPDTMQ